MGITNMYTQVKSCLEKNAAFTSFIKKTHLTTDGILGAFTLLIAFALDTTFIGPSLNNFVCLFFPMQEAIFLLKSPNPNVRDLKKILLVLSCFSAVIVVEPLLKRRVPLFPVLKIVFLCAVAFKQSLQDSIQRSLIDKLPSSNTSNANKAATAASAKIKETVEKTIKKEEDFKNK